MKTRLMSTKFLLKICIGIFLLSSIRTYGQDTLPKSARDGWAVQVGAGIMYGGNVGILTERQILLKGKLRLSPFVSVGIGEAGTDSVTSKKYFWFGYAAGANLEYGNKHRVVFGPHYMGNSLIGHSDNAKKNYFGGLSIILGYKGTADFGLIWQVYIGDFYSPDDSPFSANKKYEHRSHFGVGLGYKF